MAETLADDISLDDRRRVVSAGIRRGRESNIADMRAVAELGAKNITSMVIATRGERLVLTCSVFSVSDGRPDGFHVEMLRMLEINAENQIATCVMFDVDDIDAAFAELDARYVAGEAAAQADTWSVVVQAYAAVNLGELPPTAADYVSIDRRRLAVEEPGDFTANLDAVRNLTPDLKSYAEAVHRLSNRGAVLTHISHGTSRDGLEAEWRLVEFISIEGDRLTRCEIFDEADLDVALARFDELHMQTPKPRDS
jgi:hypothetical protein